MDLKNRSRDASRARLAAQLQRFVDLLNLSPQFGPPTRFDLYKYKLVCCLSMALYSPWVKVMQAGCLVARH